MQNSYLIMSESMCWSSIRYSWGGMGVRDSWGSMGVGDGGGSILSYRQSWSGVVRHWSSMGVRDSWGGMSVRNSWSGMSVRDSWGSMGIRQSWGSVFSYNWGSDWSYSLHSYRVCGWLTVDDGIETVMCIGGVFYGTFAAVGFYEGVAAMDSVSLAGFLLGFDITGVWVVDGVLEVVVSWGILFSDKSLLDWGSVCDWSSNLG